MFETIFTEQLDEELLGQIGISSARAFFNQQAGASRRTYEGMMRNYAVQVGPETIDVGRPQAVHPFRSFSLPVVAALSRRRAAITRLEVRCLFRIFAYGFHGLSFALLVWEFWF